MTELAALFSISAGSPEPIFRQIMGQVMRRVASGQWPPGTEMPSVRELAVALTLNPMTVSKAFSQLEAEGVLVRRRGLTMVVADTAVGQGAAPDAAALLRPSLARVVAEARQLGLTQTQALALFKEAWQAPANPDDRS